MTYLDKLLEGVEVEWKPLGEVCQIISGWGFPSIYQGKTEGKYPFYKVSDMNLIGNESVMCSANNYVSDVVIKKLGISLVPAGSVIFPKIGAAIATNKKRILSSESAYDNNVMGLSPRKNTISRYLYYWMQTINLSSLANDSGALPSIRKNRVEGHLIPIPCPKDPKKSLEIQQKIVGILDKFTKLTAELTAELALRIKQYEFYREKLLSFEEGEVEWKTLGEIGDVKMCKRILKNQTQSIGDVPFFKIGTFGKCADAFISSEIYHLYKNKYSYPKLGDVLISASGTIGRTVIYDGEPAYFQDSNIVWIDNDESIVSNKYLWHFYKIAKWFVSGGGTIDRLYNDNIKKTQIPIPYPHNLEQSKKEQARIVSILDKFDTLTTSISEGLPKEIELRKKQYEHYREILLSFPKAD